MKRAVVALLLSLLVLPAGCGPSAGVSSAAPSELPAAFEPQTALDFGEVTMLLYSFKSTLDDRDIKNQKRILQAVSDAMREQTNVRMTLEALPVFEPLKKLQELATAGTPPEISTWLPKAYGDATETDKRTGTTLQPLALDAALIQYGEHLRDRIDQATWQDNTVKDHIVSIPMAYCSVSTVPVLNQKVLQKNNWEVPKTVEEFDGLLAKAKEQGLMPVLLASATDRGLPAELSMPYLLDSPAWYGLATVSVVEEDGKLVPAMGSRRRLQWLQQQQLWAANRWVLAGSEQSGGSKYVSEGTWLCREISAHNLSSTPDIVLLPALGAGGGTPGCLPPLYTSGGMFESYARPEAMVFLLDWLCSDADNIRLISMGQKDIDYKEKANGTVTGSMAWMGSYQFSMPSVKPQNPPTSPTLQEQALENARRLGGTYSNRDGIPDMAWYNRLRGSRLDSAGLKKDEYEKKVAESELQMLKGAKTMEAHKVTLQECAPLMREYLSLIQDLRDGKYDVWQDVQTLQ